jgi:hypothetical protein
MAHPSSSYLISPANPPCKTWVLTEAIMARLEGFHICAVYWMVRRLIRGCITSGFIHPPTKCLRSVGCTPSSAILMCSGRQSPGGRLKVRFGAQAVVVGAEDVLG